MPPRNLVRQWSSGDVSLPSDCPLAALEAISETLAAEIDPAWNIKVSRATPPLKLLIVLIIHIADYAC